MPVSELNEQANEVARRLEALTTVSGDLDSRLTELRSITQLAIKVANGLNGK